MLEAFNTLLGQTARDEVPDEPLLALALDPDLPPEQRRAALAQRGFADPERALAELERLARVPHSPIADGGSGVKAVRLLSEVAQTPDPDQALLLFSDFLARLHQPEGYLRLLTGMPRASRRLFNLFGQSDYLSRIFLRHPELLDALVQAQLDEALKSPERIRQELGPGWRGPRTRRRSTAPCRASRTRSGQAGRVRAGLSLGPGPHLRLQRQRPGGDERRQPRHPHPPRVLRQGRPATHDVAAGAVARGTPLQDRRAAESLGKPGGAGGEPGCPARAPPEAGAALGAPGQGGLVDVEFTVQYLQLVHGREHPRIRGTNTLAALEGLQAEGLLPPEDAEALRQGYLFLRRVENRLRLVHASSLAHMPTHGRPLAQLARRLGVLGAEPGETFLAQYRACAARVRDVYARVLRAPRSV